MVVPSIVHGKVRYYGGPEGSLCASKLRRFQIGLDCDMVVPSIVHGKVRSWIRWPRRVTARFQIGLNCDVVVYSTRQGKV